MLGGITEQLVGQLVEVKYFDRHVGKFTGLCAIV